MKIQVNSKTTKPTSHTFPGLYVRLYNYTDCVGGITQDYKGKVFLFFDEYTGVVLENGKRVTSKQISSCADHTCWRRLSPEESVTLSND